MVLLLTTQQSAGHKELVMYIGATPVPRATKIRSFGTTTVVSATVGVPGGFTAGNIEVYINGRSVLPTDFNDSNGADVIFPAALPVGTDYLIVEARSFEIASHYTKVESDTLYYNKTESDAKFVEVGDTVTGTATFANSTNNINLTDIGSIAGLEVGDVIQVSGSVGNNSEFTVEVITDANNVIVNQAHAGGSATKSLATETSTAGVTVQLLVKWYDAPVGVGQGWVELFSSRTSGVTYTNSTGRAIVVRLASFAVGAITRVALTVDAFATYGNTTASLGGSTGHSSIETHINKGSTYEASILVNLDSWVELR
jgi:hypothetical protein